MCRKRKSYKKRISKRNREHLIRHAPSSFIRGLVRHAKALSSQGMKLSAKKRRRLAPYKHDIESLSRCTTTQQARNKLLQRGGFLLPFLAIKGRSFLKGAATRGVNKLLRGTNKILSFISRNR